jgi:uncharacterized damage-inducible protein DinB
MSLTDHFKLLATYNQWMNTKLYEAAAQLSPQELAADRGAFFGSILGTLNHILVADIIWFKRFTEQPAGQASLQAVVGLPDPISLDQIFHDNLPELSRQRSWLDAQIIHWIGEISEEDLSRTLSYCNTKGASFNRRLSYLLLHFFNHQTHHRGQVSTLLAQADVAVGVTDLLALIPKENDS